MSPIGETCTFTNEQAGLSALGIGKLTDWMWQQTGNVFVDNDSMCILYIYLDVCVSRYVYKNVLLMLCYSGVIW